MVAQSSYGGFPENQEEIHIILIYVIYANICVYLSIYLSIYLSGYLCMYLFIYHNILAHKIHGGG